MGASTKVFVPFLFLWYTCNYSGQTEDDFHGFLYRNCEGTEQLRGRIYFIWHGTAKD